MAAPHIQHDNGLTFYVGGEVHSINRDHVNFDKILTALNSDDTDAVLALMNLATTVREWLGDPDFSLEGGLIVYKGEPFSEAVSQKALRMIDEGSSPDPILNFLRKVRQNPSATAQNELLLFMVANGFMIHEDGDVLAFKGVRDDYLDCYSGKVFNGVGEVVVLPRHKVDDRREVTCSFGLHFASHNFANGYGRRTLILKIHPANVVSIPHDYNNQKGRCCEYLVYAELPKRDIQIPEKEVYGDRDFDWDQYEGDEWEAE